MTTPPQTPDLEPDHPWAVLVVCQANQARSPLTAALFARHLADASTHRPVQLSSAGLDAGPGAAAAPLMVVVAADLGLDLSCHLTASLTPEAIGSSDLVITMTERQRSTVARMRPLALTKTFTLKELVRLGESCPEPSDDLPGRVSELHRARARVVGVDEPEDVLDPESAQPEAMRRVAEELSALVLAGRRVVFPGP